MAGGPSSLALYRKYRPATFAEVKGQDHVTAPLRQALLAGRVHHAYLFSGPRGCGKTSSARILARSLNCEQGPTPDPCGTCESCLALAPGGPGSIDVIEIDAASHGGVDDARDLRERAFYAPVSGRFKVYIIDEAHMVTREGFNALLKLVEEPPPHLKFVFATTEPEKVIGTIRSRTHHYPFRLVAPQILRELLEQILNAEGVSYEPAALPLVVRAGAGSARDALSVLDQLLAGSDTSGITYAAAVSLLGYTDSSLLDETVDALASGDGAAVFHVVDRVINAGNDPRRFAADLLDRLRDLIVLGAVGDADRSGLFDGPADQVDRMREQAAKFGTAELTRAAEVLNAGLTEMRGAASPRLLLELACARMLLPAADTDEAALLARLERMERRLALGDPGQAPAEIATPDPAGSRRAKSARDGSGAPGADLPGSAPPAGATSGPVPERPVPERPVPERPAPGGPSAAGSAPAGSAADSAAAGSVVSGRPTADPVPTAPPGPTAVGPVLAAPGPAAAAQAAPGAVPAVAPTASAPGVLDAESLRGGWDSILDAVRQVRKVSWIQLSNANVASLEGNVLTLEFARDGELKGFSASGSDAILARVLRERFGVDWHIRGVPAASSGRLETSGLVPGGQDKVTAQVAAHDRARPAAGRGPRAQDRPGSAPGGQADTAHQPARQRSAEMPPTAAGTQLQEPDLDDEAYVDDDDADAGLTGMELITRELGGQVIGEIDSSGGLGRPYPG
ncbi:MAG TPA: DNA polymerase III subunit gamma and tau [Streptosporangiaceae bacterium]|nr:DNA polymerase III subunit gamma and tau [Streptosporangiaceae bacterium]